MATDTELRKGFAKLVPASDFTLPSVWRAWPVSTLR
jgi:hypothetical protein